MRAQEPRSFDERELIDLNDAEQVQRLADAWEVDAEEVRAAVERVGDNPMAVKLWLSAPAP